MQDASKLLFAIFIALLFPKSGIDGNRFSFLVDWHDNEASLVRKFNLFYFPSDDAIELVSFVLKYTFDILRSMNVSVPLQIELKNRRTFLKKIKCEGITFKSLYLGSFINVFSRQMKVVDYGDAFTRDYFSSQTERTFALMKPESLKHLGNIVEEIYSRGFEITKAKMCLLSEAQAKEFYKEHEDKSFFLGLIYRTLVRHMSSEPVLAMELMGKDAIKAWRREIGPTDVEVAKKEAPSSLRSLFGINKTQNGFHGSDSLESAQRELQIFFPSDTSLGKKAPRTSATFVNCTCCIIKPHAVKEG
ncbi:hypothetical protein J437_LFUL013982 [Ladona fulva]|uniref:Nucleoside diphosphate kinase n=1 Tax=Ladona fulva TaxID=123851 RepID=A0A8K0KEX4_LADFU|nr:hypothetical protein J437_LFUL013982 [Ladona fulva]